MWTWYQAGHRKLVISHNYTLPIIPLNEVSFTEELRAVSTCLRGRQINESKERLLCCEWVLNFAMKNNKYSGLFSLLIKMLVT
jgi:hypothetical protein